MDGYIEPAKTAGRDLNELSLRVETRETLSDSSPSRASSYANTEAGHQHIDSYPCEYEGTSHTPTSERSKRLAQSKKRFSLLWPILAFIVGSLVIASICSPVLKHTPKLISGGRRLASSDSEKEEDSEAHAAEELKAICLQFGEWSPQAPAAGGQRSSPVTVEEYFLALEQERESPPISPLRTAEKRSIADIGVGGADADGDAQPGPSSKIFKSSSDQSREGTPTGQHQHGNLQQLTAVPPDDEDAWIQPFDSEEPAGSEEAQVLAHESYDPPLTPLPGFLMTEAYEKASASFSEESSSPHQDQEQTDGEPTVEAAGPADDGYTLQVLESRPPQSSSQRSPAYPLKEIEAHYAKILELIPHAVPFSSAAASGASTFAAASSSFSATTSPSGSVTQEQGGDEENRGASSSTIFKLKDLLTCKSLRKAAQRSFSKKDASRHPYARLPEVDDNVRVHPSYVNSPKIAPKASVFLSTELSRFRVFCRKRVLVQRDVTRLLRVAGRLMKYGHDMNATPRQVPSDAVEALGRRFLLLHALYSIKRILGHRVRWDAWWGDFTASFPSDYCRPRPFAKKMSRELHSFALQLSRAIMMYKIGQAPSDEEVVSIKMKLFLGPTCVKCFRRPDWDSWREEGQRS